NISVPKEYSIRRHYETHREKYDQYKEKSRVDKLWDFKAALVKQQSLLRNVKRDNEAVVKASYIIAELVAKNSKCFSESEFIKGCLVKTTETVCPDKVQIFKNISLSRNTVAERVDDNVTNLSEQLFAKVKSFTAFSIAVDESADVSGVEQLAVFIRACDTDLIITEELLDIISLKNTTGEDIFNKVYGLLEKYNLPLSKLVCEATDGAPSMTGKQNRFVANCKFHHIHCIIHQEVLSSKFIKMNHVLQFVKKVVNFIQSQGLNQCQFSSLLSDIGCEFESLPYYAEVCWLSCYSVLKHFWLLREEIKIFLEMKGESPDKLYDDNWVQDLAIMVNITWHLNDL
ncbi:hypothetical protein B7P43_G16671, partial [Cryptotermes secundus]